MVTLTVLAENYVPASIGLQAEHGFSVLIESNNRLYLFDTGQHGLCTENANALGADLKHVEKVILSHGHYDHTGGLQRVLKTIGRPVEIIAHPTIFDRKYVVKPTLKDKLYIGITVDKDYLTSTLRASLNLQSGFYHIADNLWSTGEVPFTNTVETTDKDLKKDTPAGLVNDDFTDDLSLAIETEKGIVVLLGCAHRGLMNIVSYIKKTLSKPIRAIIGGTHLMDADSSHIDTIVDFLQEEHITLFAPSHCTGIDNIVRFKNLMPGVTVPAFTGTRFEL